MDVLTLDQQIQPEGRRFLQQRQSNSTSKMPINFKFKRQRGHPLKGLVIGGCYSQIANCKTDF